MHDAHAIYVQWTKNTSVGAKKIFPFSKSSLGKRETCLRLIILKPTEFEKYVKYYEKKKHGWLSEAMIKDVKYVLSQIQDQLEAEGKTVAEVAELKQLHKWFVKPRDGVFWPANKSWRKFANMYEYERQLTPSHPDYVEENNNGNLN